MTLKELLCLYIGTNLSLYVLNQDNSELFNSRDTHEPHQRMTSNIKESILQRKVSNFHVHSGILVVEVKDK